MYFPFKRVVLSSYQESIVSNKSSDETKSRLNSLQVSIVVLLRTRKVARFTRLLPHKNVISFGWLLPTLYSVNPPSLANMYAKLKVFV